MIEGSISEKPAVEALVAGPLAASPGQGTGPTGSVERSSGAASFPEWWVFAGAGGLLIILLWQSNGAVILGADEGMELAKGLLLVQRPELASAAWNDQPWFFSQVLALFGGVPLAGRVFTGVCTLALVWALGRFSRGIMGGLPESQREPWSVLAERGVCLLFLFAWSSVTQLSVSVMCEWPAFCLAVAAVAVLPLRSSEWRMWRFVLAGAVLAVATQIKLTALIIGPALAAHVVVAYSAKVGWASSLPSSGTVVESYKKRDRLEALSYLCGFSGVFAVVFGLLLWWSPVWDWSQLWGSHAAAGEVAQAAVHTFRPWDWIKDAPGTMLAAMAGVWFLVRSGSWRELVFPLTLLATALAIHSVHRPFWYYYGVHFAVPLAILAGKGVVGLIGVFFHKAGNLQGRDARPTEKQRELAMMIGVFCVAVWFGFEGPRLVSQISGITHAEKVPDNEMIATLKEYQGRVKWAYSRSNIPVYHAGFIQPPELTILSKKRFWSGSMTEASVLETVRNYDCEVLVLLPEIEMKQEAWKKLTSENYVEVMSSGGSTLFVAKRLDPKPKVNAVTEALKKLGL